MIPFEAKQRFLNDFLSKTSLEDCGSVFEDLVLPHCWVWKTEIHPDKKLMKRYVVNRKRTWFSLPRLAYEIFTNTEIPKDKVIMHLCHNKHCINPYHLTPGTRRENKLAEIEIRTLKHDLNKQQALEIRQKYHPMKYSIEALSDEYNVDTKVIWHIVKFNLFKDAR